MVRVGGGLLALFWIALAPAEGTAQQIEAATGVVAGVVRQADAPVAGAVVTIQAGGGSQVVTSDGAGEFRARVASGTVELVVRGPGHEPVARSVTVPAGDTVRVVVELRQRVVTLAELQVTATPVARDPLRVPQSTTTLSGSTLERERGATLGATLASQPGISERYDGPAASAPVIRGLGGERIVILQDGQRSGDLAATAPDHAVTIDPSSASRIEIVRGPAALLYGNNAIGGVVNVISGDLPRSVPSAVSGSVQASAGTGAGGGAASVELSAPLGGTSALQLRAGHRAQGDLAIGSRGADAELPWSGVRRLPNTFSRASTASMGASWLDNGFMLSSAFRLYSFEYGLPFDQGADPVVLRGARRELLARLERTDGSLAGARLSAGAQWYDHDEVDHLGALMTALGARTLNAELVTPMTLAGVGAVGVSGLWRNNDVTGDAALTPVNSASSVGMFIYQEFGIPGIPSLAFPLGIRLDRHRARSEADQQFGPAVHRRFDAVSGSVGANLLLGTGFSLGASLARAVRAPTAEELFSQAGHAGTGAFEIGDPTLGAEFAHGAELVMRARGARHRLQAALFVNRMTGYIGLFPAGRDTIISDGAGGSRSYPLHLVSQRDATLSGAEAAVEWQLPRGVAVGVMGDVVRGRDAAGSPLPFIPAARIGASANVERGKWSTGARVRRALRQGRVPEGEFRAAAYTLVDAHASLHLTLFQRPHALVIRADNLADEAYRDASSRIKEFAPGPGRSISLRWQASF